jgi:hypothetical protein
MDTKLAIGFRTAFELYLQARDVSNRGGALMGGKPIRPFNAA